MKFYLVANLTNDELNLFYEGKTGEKIGSQNELINFVKKTNTEEILTQIENFKNGIIK